MSLDSGILRHRVRIERYEEVRDTSGAVIQDQTTGEVARGWVEVAEVWAAIEPLSAKEFIQSSALQSQVTARVVIRVRDDVDATCRLVHLRRGKPDVVYSIHGVLPDKESGQEYMTLPVSTGTGD
ncbi:MAG TPA: phage head closure protein [Methylophilaceae bacterium]